MKNAPPARRGIPAFFVNENFTLEIKEAVIDPYGKPYLYHEKKRRKETFTWKSFRWAWKKGRSET
ncbi:MAG: hypothetical protein ABII89_01910 [Candidatus Omnitrophota bacterium]